MKTPLFLFMMFLVVFSMDAQNEIKSAATEQLKKALTGESNTTIVGKFELLNDSILVHTLGIYKKVDSLFININCGFIKDIDVYIGKEKFSNNVPIPLIHYSSRTTDRLYNMDARFSDQYIILGDFLIYQNVTGNNFTTDNLVLKLSNSPTDKEKEILKVQEGGTEKDITSELRVYYLKSDESINKFIDYRIYSDFLGIIDETTNGIVNFEAKANIPLATQNINHTNFYIFKTVSPELRYSRFDNKDRLIEIDTTGGQVNIKDKIDLIQKSFLSAGLQVEVIKYIPKNAFVEFTIPFYAHFLMAESKILQDGTLSDTQKENLTSIRYGTGINACVNRSNNFVFNLGFNFYQLQHLYREKYQMNAISHYNLYNLLSELSFVGKNTNDAVFLRFNYTSELNKPNNFFQLQVGYKSSFNL